MSIKTFLSIITSGEKWHRHWTNMKLSSAHVSSACVCAHYQIDCTVKGYTFGCMQMLSIRIQTKREDYQLIMT